MKLNSFYSSNTQSLLNESLNDAEGAMNCPETRLGAIELKISLLILLKEFEAGYKFVFSLSEMDFELLYRKKMNLNFLALQYENRKDTVQVRNYYNNIIHEVQKYIQNEKSNTDKFDKEAYYDLFFIKNKILSRQEINEEIDSLKNKYATERFFLEALKETLSGETKTVNPVKN